MNLWGICWPFTGHLQDIYHQNIGPLQSIFGAFTGHLRAFRVNLQAFMGHLRGIQGQLRGI